MSEWRQQGSIWQLRPPRPTAVVEFIGGSYLAATPQVSYRRLLEGLAARGLAIHAWTYVPGFDHQNQAQQAWKDLRDARRRLVDRSGPMPAPLRLGHSLGCKLHLLAPDGGRSCSGCCSNKGVQSKPRSARPAKTTLSNGRPSASVFCVEQRVNVTRSNDIRTAAAFAVAAAEVLAVQACHGQRCVSRWSDATLSRR